MGAVVHIVAVTPLYPPRSRVGAWMSTHECLRFMVDRGHDVTAVIQLGTHEAEYTLDGVRVLTGASNIERQIATADVVVSHLGDTGRAARAAAAAGVPSVRMGHGGDITSAQCAGAALVVHNSQSFAEHVGWVGSQIVVHPPVWPEEYRTAPGDLVTLVNLSESKGVGMFTQLAKSMPGVQFLGVMGSYGAQTAPDLPNVEVIPPTTNMRDDVYARTRVLLMPSERETWGRVGVEAMCSGIPVIAHPTEGLRESLGEAGMFVDRDDPSAWARVLFKLLGRPSSWQYASRQARKRAAELYPLHGLELFAERVEALQVVAL